MTQEQRTEIMHNYKMFVKILKNKPIMFTQHTGDDGTFYYTIIAKPRIGGIWVYNGNMVYINGDKSLMENIYESYLSYLGVNSGSMVADNNGSYSNNSGNNYSGHSHFVPFINGFGAGYLSSSLSSSSDRAFSPSSKPSPSTVKSGFTGGGGRSSAVS